MPTKPQPYSLFLRDADGNDTEVHHQARLVYVLDPAHLADAYGVACESAEFHVVATPEGVVHDLVVDGECLESTWEEWGDRTETLLSRAYPGEDGNDGDD